jgi:hypothetical protein
MHFASYFHCRQYNKLFPLLPIQANRLRARHRLSKLRRTAKVAAAPVALTHDPFSEWLTRGAADNRQSVTGCFL